MARIRTLKPEFFRSKSLAACSVEARMTFAGLWTEADDEGRGKAEPRLIATQIWPWDGPSDEMVDGWLTELAATGHIHLYSVDDQRYFAIRKWQDHQSASFRRGGSKLPAPPLHDSARGGVQESAGEDRTGQEGIGGETTGPADLPPLVDLVLDAYVMSVCLKNGKTHKPFRDAVKRNAVTERAPMLIQHLATHPKATEDDLRRLLNLPTEAPKPAWYANPQCPDCEGDGWSTQTGPDERTYYGECACRQDEPYPEPLADVINLDRKATA